VKYLKPLAKAVLPRHYHNTAKYVYLRLRALLYLGNELTRTCCGQQLRKFLTRGIKPRPNAECPRCGCFEMHRLLWLYLQNKTNLFSDTVRVLHFAPEHVFQKTLLALPNPDYLRPIQREPPQWSKWI